MHLLLDPSCCNIFGGDMAQLQLQRALEHSRYHPLVTPKVAAVLRARCQPVCVGALHGQELSFLTAAVASSVVRRSPSHQARLSACALVRRTHPSHPSARNMQRASVASTRVSASSAGLQRCECRGQNNAQHTHPANAHAPSTQNACACTHALGCC